MTTLAKYRVVLSGNVMPEYERREVVQGLANLFNSPTSVMEDLVKGKAVPLKKQYDQSQAEIICQSIRNVGAQCSIEEILETEIAPEPTAHKSTTSESTTSESAASESTTSESAASESAASESTTSEQAARPSSNEKLQALLLRFVKINTEYYQQQFSKFGNPRNPVFKITWHWHAFFYFFFWALYRKMWLWAMVNVLSGIGLTLLVGHGLVYLVWIFIWPLLANYLYFRVAATAAHRACQDQSAAQYYLAKGGVSKRALWGGLVIALVSTMLVSSYVAKRFVDEYGVHIKDVLPGSGTQIRGDGSILKDVAGQSKLAHTSLILSGLATAFKLVLLTNNEQHIQTTQTQLVVARFTERLSAGDISDGWGGEIRIEQQLDRYVLISAGQDQIFKTDDDVLQPIFIP